MVPPTAPRGWGIRAQANGLRTIHVQAIRLHTMPAERATYVPANGFSQVTRGRGGEKLGEKTDTSVGEVPGRLAILKTGARGARPICLMRQRVSPRQVR